MIYLQQRKLKVTRNWLWIFCWVHRKIVRGMLADEADEAEMYLQSKSPPRSTDIFERWKPDIKYC